MKLTLYDLEDSYINVLELLEEDENLDLAKVLDQINEAFELKAENIGKLIKEIEGDNLSLDVEIKRLQNKKRVKENTIKNLKYYLESSMRSTGKLKFETTLFKFGIQKNGGKLPLKIIEDISLIPDKYFKRTEETLNTTLIREDLDKGEINFAEFGERGESLRIR